jgi:hypothetical protein
MNLETFHNALGCRLRMILIMLFINIATSPLLSGQTTSSDFLIVSPGHVVDLVQVDRTPSNNLNFILKNASTKTILELCISALSDSRVEETVCMHGFAAGATHPEPNETMSFLFDANNFISDRPAGQRPQRSLRVEVAVYTDGSSTGSKYFLDKIENHMLGVALETKRISDILAGSSDNSISGLQSMLPKIGISPPSTTDAEASGELIDNLRDKSLPGLSQDYIDSHLIASQTSDLLDGIALARSRAIYEINELRTKVTLAHDEGNDKSNTASEVQLHGRADLAHKYRSHSDSQISHFTVFIGARYAH